VKTPQIFAKESTEYWNAIHCGSEGCCLNGDKESMEYDIQGAGSLPLPAPKNGQLSQKNSLR